MTQRTTDHQTIIGDGRRGATNWIEVDDPYRRSIWARVPIATAADVDDAVMAARDAFETGEWAASTAPQRAGLLHALADVVGSHVDELTDLQVRENGKAIREQHAQTLGFAPLIRYFAGLAEQVRGATIPTGSSSSFCYTTREPVGVVATLTPWNSPLALLLWKLAPALATGNTVVAKPSEITPVSTIRFGELMLEAGFPPGVFNVVTGLADTGAALVGHPGVDKIAFTGSTEVGRQIGRVAGEQLKRCSLELGGKSPNIIFDDASIAAALDGVVGGIFAAAGQTCIAGSRVLVQRGIADEFVERLAERAAAVRLGDPASWETEVGTIACERQLARTIDYVDVARHEGARLVTGGEPWTDPSQPDAWFFKPTVFADVHNGMRIAREEVFGPVASVITFSDEAEAVAIANDSNFGLAAGVWTSNVSRALRLTRALRAGTVWVNTYRRTTYALPFGGVGDSGVGREMGHTSIDEFTELKSVWIDTSEGGGDPFNPLR